MAGLKQMDVSLPSRSALPESARKSTPQDQAKKGTIAAEKILRCFPDYGKAPDGYLLSLAKLLSDYDDDMLAQMVDLKTGVPSQCRFLPTIADITAFARKVEEVRDAKRERDREMERLGKRRAVDTTPYRPEQIPYISNRPYRQQPSYLPSPEDLKASVEKERQTQDEARRLGGGDLYRGWLKKMGLPDQS